MRIDLHVHVHSDPDHTVVGRLDQVFKILHVINGKADTLMALADDLKAGIQKLNDDTDKVAANIAQLASRIKNTMTDQEVADIKAALTAESDRLGTLAQDPTNPVPPEPPPLVTARQKAGLKV